MKELLDFIKNKNIENQHVLKILNRKNLLSTALEVSSISSRLLLSRDNKLNKIYLSNLIYLELQLYYLIDKLELFKLYNSNLNISDVNILSEQFLKYINQAYYAPYDVLESDKFKLCNNIGIMSLNLSLALWTDFENNLYDIDSLILKFKRIINEGRDFFILILELYTYICSYLRKHSSEELLTVLNYIFAFKKSDIVPTKKVDSTVEEYAISDKDELNKLNIETKLIN